MILFSIINFLSGKDVITSSYFIRRCSHIVLLSNCPLYNPSNDCCPYGIGSSIKEFCCNDLKGRTNNGKSGSDNSYNKSRRCPLFCVNCLIFIGGLSCLLIDRKAIRIRISQIINSIIIYSSLVRKSCSCRKLSTRKNRSTFCGCCYIVRY